MAGTKQGGQRAAITNKARHGADFYARIGKIGGLKPNTGTGGFSYPNPCDCRLIDAPHFIRQCAGVIGGRKSRRTKKVVVADGAS